MPTDRQPETPRASTFATTAVVVGVVLLLVGCAIVCLTPVGSLLGGPEEEPLASLEHGGSRWTLTRVPDPFESDGSTLVLRSCGWRCTDRAWAPDAPSLRLEILPDGERVSVQGCTFDGTCSPIGFRWREP